ncbi:hypothetical protein RF11_02659 [Thelohanellus kitauei]|uniref:Uncharacterized protein n=1 Tax=Thelohanellus kitauei TaxID=669202 RepID=A0A0C2NJH3_THEKT|nr:hypothetical protein RF11_02659 [Thelohanellus kitauei]
MRICIDQMLLNIVLFFSICLHTGFNLGCCKSKLSKEAPISISKDYQLQYKYWKNAPNYFVFYFQELYDMPDISNQILYISKNGGKTLGRWKPEIDGNSIYVEEFLPIKNTLVFSSVTITQLNGFIQQFLVHLSNDPQSDPSCDIINGSPNSFLKPDSTLLNEIGLLFLEKEVNYKAQYGYLRYKLF